MQPVETVLVFAGIPAAVIAVVTGLVYAGSSRPNRRYRPGRPFDFTPVWYLAAVERDGADPSGADSAGFDPSGADPSGRGAATGDSMEIVSARQWPPNDPEQGRAPGGASDRW